MKQDRPKKSRVKTATDAATVAGSKPSKSKARAKPKKATKKATSKKATAKKAGAKTTTKKAAASSGRSRRKSTVREAMATRAQPNKATPPTVVDATAQSNPTDVGDDAVQVRDVGFGAALEDLEIEHVTSEAVEPRDAAVALQDDPEANERAKTSSDSTNQAHALMSCMFENAPAVPDNAAPAATPVNFPDDAPAFSESATVGHDTATATPVAVGNPQPVAAGAPAAAAAAAATATGQTASWQRFARPFLIGLVVGTLIGMVF